MAIWYVSNEAINGYTVGHDTTGNGSAALPYLTIAKAIAVAANTGDTIYVNGVSHTISPLTINKAVNLQPTVAYGTTLLCGNATRGILVNHAFGSTNTFGAFTIDAADVSATAIQITASAVKYGFVFQGTRIVNSNYDISHIVFGDNLEIRNVSAVGAAGYTAKVYNRDGVSARTGTIRTSITTREL